MKIWCILLRIFLLVLNSASSAFYGLNHERGYNSPIYGSLHAEVAAIKKCIINKPVDLIVIRVNSFGELKESKPCFHCLKFIKNSKKIQIKHIYYSTNGIIKKTTLNKLLYEEKYHYSGCHIK